MANTQTKTSNSTFPRDATNYDLDSRLFCVHDDNSQIRLAVVVVRMKLNVIFNKKINNNTDTPNQASQEIGGSGWPNW